MKRSKEETRSLLFSALSSPVRPTRKAQRCLSQASRPQGMGHTLPDPTPPAPHRAPPSLMGRATCRGSHSNPGPHQG